MKPNIKIVWIELSTNYCLDIIENALCDVSALYCGEINIIAYKYVYIYTFVGCLNFKYVLSYFNYIKK